MNLSKQTLVILHRVQAELMILEKKQVSQDLVIRRALANYHNLIDKDAEEEFNRTFPNSFSELKERGEINHE